MPAWAIEMRLLVQSCRCNFLVLQFSLSLAVVCGSYPSEVCCQWSWCSATVAPVACTGPVSHDFSCLALFGWSSTALYMLYLQVREGVAV